MANYGLQTFDDDGTKWLEITDRLTRVVDHFEVTSASGSRTYPGLGSRGYFLVSGYGGDRANAGQWGSSQPPFLMPEFVIEGDTLRWSYNWDKRYHFDLDSKFRSQIWVTVIFYR